MMYLEISELLGKTLSSLERKGDEAIIFTVNEGTQYCMFHVEHGREYVRIEDIEGDLQDLVGSPVLQAEETTNRDEVPNKDGWSFTWTFYKLATVKGYVTIRWLGESNGHYSEEVHIVRIGDENEYLLSIFNK